MKIIICINLYEDNYMHIVLCIKFYEDNYAIKDKQDLLAMCLIEYASKFENVNNNKVVEDDRLTERLAELDIILTSNI